MWIVRNDVGITIDGHICVYMYVFSSVGYACWSGIAK